ncbi:MAG: YceI family protein [Gelidibacter sp.]|nr:YceI family protein [Gelidibacter sp.]
MKTHILFVATLVVSSIVNAQSILSTNQFEIDPSKSVLNWHGSSLFQINDHNGTVQFSSGYLKIENGQLWGGSFKVDMTTIHAIDGGANGELDKHLKNADFFDVTKYPTAWLSIQKVNPIEKNTYEVEANLNIKGITKPVLFVAKLQDVGTNWQLSTRFIIDRSRWNIIYASKGSEIMNPIKDYSISDAIKFEVTIITR